MLLTEAVFSSSNMSQLSHSKGSLGHPASYTTRGSLTISAWTAFLLQLCSDVLHRLRFGVANVALPQTLRLVKMQRVLEVNSRALKYVVLKLSTISQLLFGSYTYLLIH